MNSRSQIRAGWALGLVFCLGCNAVPDTDPTVPDVATPEPDTAQSTEQPLSAQASHGKTAFEDAQLGTNGRSCATCHVENDHTILTPANVQQRAPTDPLFARIDADDPDASVPTFNHLALGLIRVVLPLPDNVDVIDVDGGIITNPERTVFVWRGVPSVADTAITKPYQLDGRAATLEAQAQGAITNHAQGPTAPQHTLEKIAQFERETFTSWRPAFVAALLEAGVKRENIPNPDDWLTLDDQERRGKAVFTRGCAPCHGGPTTTQIVDRTVHDELFFKLGPDGNVVYDISDAGVPVPEYVARPHDEFANPGFALLSYLGQIGVLPTANASVTLPQYRLRFYTDASRTQAVVDLPPIPQTASGAPFDPTPALDSRGAPIQGPSLAPQWFSTDPGRALITGDPADWEAFDIPSLRGISKTAPYFHDNSHATLEAVVNSYSNFVLGFIPALGFPFVPTAPGAPPESLTAQQKSDLIAFLKRL